MNVVGPTYAARLSGIKNELADANALLDQQADIIADAHRDRDLARAELSSARDELDAQRRTRDRLDHHLSEARRQIGRLEEDLAGAVKSHTEQTMRAIDAEQKLAGMYRAFTHGDTNA